ncbi:MAG: hypothetical protein J6X14_02140 [Lachnospiraceae bacterium]|nr:hypothetical protein [Lachnospiraceae bacterium]MCR5459286.1 hypothetical protein [Acetatifactor sp.]
MMDAMNKPGFPSNEVEALTMLYLEELTLSGLAPEEIYDKYVDAYKRIAKQKELSQSEQAEAF